MANDVEFMAGIKELIDANPGDTRISECILNNIHLADEIPKSKIVHENHRDHEEKNHKVKMYFKIARDLINKYVSNRAEIEVNLSHKCRQRIVNFIGKYGDISSIDALNENEELELFVLFNEASSELYVLLDGNHQRYTKENEEYPQKLND